MGYQFGGSPLHLLQGFGVFLTGRGPDNCGILAPDTGAVEGSAGVESLISKRSLQLVENSRGFVDLNLDMVGKFQVT